LLALAAVLLAFSLFFVRGADHVAFAQDVALKSASFPREVVHGKTLPLTLTFKTKHPLDADDWVFIHVESPGAKSCRMVADRLPSPAPTPWGYGGVGPAGGAPGRG